MASSNSNSRVSKKVVVAGMTLARDLWVDMGAAEGMLSGDLKSCGLTG